MLFTCWDAGPSGSMPSLPAELPRDVSFAITSIARQGARRTDVYFLFVPRFTAFQITRAVSPQKSP